MKTLSPLSPGQPQEQPTRPASPRQLSGFRAILRKLYYGRGRTGHYFQVGLLLLDLAAIVYFLATTFIKQAAWIDTVDVVIGLVLILEFLGRMFAHRHPMQYLDNASALVDLAVILSLLAAPLIENLSFLRILRTVRLLRSYQVLGHLKREYLFIRRNEEVLTSALNILVFMIMVSAIVYVSQVDRNPGINNFVDALYFTVTTLTTTGYGDILLQGVDGRLLAVGIMIVGISLFLRLVQAVFRPGGKVRFPCPQCGLLRHDYDAVHCKACGHLLAIPNDES
jgi:voltage-gated potassium channel